MHNFKIGDEVLSILTGYKYIVDEISQFKIKVDNQWWPAGRFSLIKNSYKYKVVFISSPSELEKILNENQEWKFNTIYQDRIIFSRD